jgi:hypothetical protein
MGLALVTTLSLCLWIVLWALNVKSVDAIMITVAIVLVAATLKSLAKYLPGMPAQGPRRPDGGW